MAFVVKHGAVGALGRLAVQAGRAKGRQIQAGIDLQITQMALNAQDRKFALEERARDRAFALQQAAASRIAQAPAKGNLITTRRQLGTAVRDAERSGIYSPEQIKQMGIFAKLGDTDAVKDVLGVLPETSARRAEIGMQSNALTKIAAAETAALDARFAEVRDSIRPLYDTDEIQDFLRANPEHINPEAREAFKELDAIDQQREETKVRMARAQRFLQLGLTMPEQMALTQQAEVRIQREQERGIARADKVAGAQGRLTDTDELVLDLIRDKEKDRRRGYQREIARLSKQLERFQKEDDKDFQARVTPIQGQIADLKRLENATHSAELSQIRKYFADRNRGNRPAAIVTDRTGARYKFTRMVNGKPKYERIR